MVDVVVLATTAAAGAVADGVDAAPPLDVVVAAPDVVVEAEVVVVSPTPVVVVAPGAVVVVDSLELLADEDEGEDGDDDVDDLEPAPISACSIVVTE